MNLKTETGDVSAYLAQTRVIDQNHPEIAALSGQMIRFSSGLDLVKGIYEYVRDKIPHSADIQSKVVTCTASDVLNNREGICFAKSHLLAALLRRCDIPAGFCYQLLRLDGDESPLVLHGLNAIYLKSIGKWIRLDARGNKSGVNAQFRIHEEMLAFPVREELGETDYLTIYANPDPGVIYALTHYSTFDELWSNLPQKLSDV